MSCVYIEYDDLLEKHHKVILESDNTEDPGVRHPEAIRSTLDFGMTLSILCLRIRLHTWFLLLP